jgi:hypothetical protein
MNSATTLMTSHNIICNHTFLSNHELCHHTDDVAQHHPQSHIPIKKPSRPALLFPGADLCLAAVIVLCDAISVAAEFMVRSMRCGLKRFDGIEIDSVYRLEE